MDNTEILKVGGKRVSRFYSLFFNVLVLPKPKANLGVKTEKAATCFKERRMKTNWNINLFSEAKQPEKNSWCSLLESSGVGRIWHWTVGLIQATGPRPPPHTWPISLYETHSAGTVSCYSGFLRNFKCFKKSKQPLKVALHTLRPLQGTAAKIAESPEHPRLRSGLQFLST